MRVTKELAPPVTPKYTYAISGLTQNQVDALGAILYQSLGGTGDVRDDMDDLTDCLREAGADLQHFKIKGYIEFESWHS